MHGSIGVHPPQELSPSGVMNALGQMRVLAHVAYLKGFIGNQIVRGDERACRFPGKVFTLPLDFQIRFSELLSGFLAVAALLLFAGVVSMQPLEFLFGLAIVSRVV